jgi:two-component system, OmpR family, phosphate regulon response regulator PhoB
MIRITIIDDDPDSRNLLHVFLRNQNFSVSIFESAEKFFSHQQVETDLYIIDINLGGITGIEMCARLKTVTESKDTPVIIISAHPEVEKLAAEVCADDFLSKPFSQKKLLEKINFLSRKNR